MDYIRYIPLFLFFIFFPMLIPGIVKKVRAKCQGRKGPVILQPWYDIQRMMKKTPVDGPNSGIFAEVAPLVSFLAALTAWSVPVFEWTSFILIPFFLVLQRIALLAFAMETGTSFGGLGSSREVLLYVLGEPVLVIAIIVSQSSFQVAFSVMGIALGVLFLAACSIIMLAEMAKPPFDDPRTHLELTMVHEAMLLEASGKTMAFFEIASILKMAALITLLMRIAFEHVQLSSLGIAGKFLEEIIMIAGAVIVPVMIGRWEAVSVRRKWEWIPEFMGMTLIFILALGTIVRL